VSKINKMNIAIIKYNAGNIRSVDYALQRLGVEATITNDIEILEKADKIIFPGVGEASSAMQYLKEHQLDKVIQNAKQPLLGICLGMQLLCAYSPEGNTTCLNIFEDVHLQKFEAVDAIKVPQIGWNEIAFTANPLFVHIPAKAFVYNVHSYYVPIQQYTIATCNYTMDYSAAIHKNNFYGVQFHPEKSSTVGEQILQNFLNL
jgi:imidazole glycerol-phosphate synthase subunit HisH